MSEFPKEENISIPDNLDPKTLEVIAGFWNTAIVGISAEKALFMDNYTKPIDFSNLKGKALDNAIENLEITDEPYEIALLACNALANAIKQFGHDLDEACKKNIEP